MSRLGIAVGMMARVGRQPADRRVASVAGLFFGFDSVPLLWAGSPALVEATFQ